MNLALLGARNVARNKFRATLTVLGVAVAILAFVLLRTVISAWDLAAQFAAKDRLGTRHKVSFVIALPKHYIDTVRAVPGVKQATYANWFGGKYPKDPNFFFANFAVDAPTYLDVYDELTVAPEDKQRWFEDRQGSLVGANLARKLGLKVGDKLTLTGGIFPGDWTFNISGIYTAARKSVDEGWMLFHWSYLNDSLPEARRDQIGWIASRVDDPGRGGEIAKQIDAIFDEKDVQTLTMSERAMQLSFMGMVSALLKAIDIISIIILLIMMMILGNTIAMGVRERTNEYGVLRALGFSPKHIAGFVVSEALALGLAGGLLGLALSYPIVQQGLGRFLEENQPGYFPWFRITPEVATAALVLSVALGAAAALLPALRASRLSVTNALRRVG